MSSVFCPVRNLILPLGIIEGLEQTPAMGRSFPSLLFTCYSTECVSVLPSVDKSQEIPVSIEKQAY